MFEINKSILKNTAKLGCNQQLGTSDDKNCIIQKYKNIYMLTKNVSTTPANLFVITSYLTESSFFITEFSCTSKNRHRKETLMVNFANIL